MAAIDGDPLDEHDEVAVRRPASLKRPAFVLGLCGLAPFAVLSGLLAYAGRDFIAYPQLVLALSGYAATILAFLGGIRWGAALILRPDGGRRMLALSVLPSLAGWLLLFAPSPWVFLLFAMAFLLQGAWDVLAARRGVLPAWFGRLRLILTAGAVSAMLLAFAATLT